LRPPPGRWTPTDGRSRSEGRHPGRHRPRRGRPLDRIRSNDRRNPSRAWRQGPRDPIPGRPVAGSDAIRLSVLNRSKANSTSPARRLTFRRTSRIGSGPASPGSQPETNPDRRRAESGSGNASEFPRPSDRRRLFGTGLSQSGGARLQSRVQWDRTPAESPVIPGVNWRRGV
jgi:hypothetical protein